MNNILKDSSDNSTNANRVSGNDRRLKASISKGPRGDDNTERENRVNLE